MNENMNAKDTYAEVGINYRYFLDWRRKILAGYLATVSALITGLGYLIKQTN